MFLLYNLEQLRTHGVLKNLFRNPGEVALFFSVSFFVQNEPDSGNFLTVC